MTGELGLAPAWIRAVLPSLAWSGLRDLSATDGDQATHWSAVAAVLAQIAAVDAVAADRLLGSLCDFATSTRSVAGIEGPFVSAYLSAGRTVTSARAEAVWAALAPGSAATLPFPVLDRGRLLSVAPADLPALSVPGVVANPYWSRPPLLGTTVATLTTAVVGAVALRSAGSSIPLREVLSGFGGRRDVRTNRTDAAARSLAAGKSVAVDAVVLGAQDTGLRPARPGPDGPFDDRSNEVWRRGSGQAPTFVVTGAPAHPADLPALHGDEVATWGFLASLLAPAPSDETPGLGWPGLDQAITTIPRRPGSARVAVDTARVRTRQPLVPVAVRIAFMIAHPRDPLIGSDPAGVSPYRLSEVFGRGWAR